MEHKTVKETVDDPVSSTTLLVGIFGVLIVILICIMLQAIYLHSVETERERKVLLQPPAELLELQAKQQDQLEGEPRWVDEQAGAIAIPIDEAMKLVIEDYEARAGASR